jgi:molybdate transport system ATP-binding protein
VTARWEANGGISARFLLRYPAFALDVDLALPGRGVTALFGHSGSGKTTLLRCIAGLERAPVGQLSVNGEVWQDGHRCLPTHRRPLGYVFQEASLFPHLSARRNIEYGRRRASDGLDGPGLAHVVDLLGIGHLLARRPDQLSGGERQRVAIARALAVKPRLLLMDEPLAALDLQRKQEILPYLERLHDELSIPILYVTHSPDEVARLADHIVVLEGGRALAQGALAETLARVDLPIRLGEDAGVVIEGVVEAEDPVWHLVRVAFPGGTLWTPAHGRHPGQRIRVRVLARDVSLTLRRQEDTSILNLLPGEVRELAGDTNPALMLARVRIGETDLIARLTRRSAAALALAPGRSVWAQVKSVALVG